MANAPEHSSFSIKEGAEQSTIMASCQVRRLALEGTRVRGVVIERRTGKSSRGGARGIADVRRDLLTTIVDAVGMDPPNICDRSASSP